MNSLIIYNLHFILLDIFKKPKSENINIFLNISSIEIKRLLKSILITLRVKSLLIFPHLITKCFAHLMTVD